MDPRDLEKRKEATMAGVEGQRDVHQAGGGPVGRSLGGVHTGRYGASSGNVTSNRERKPHGSDKES